jgi:hypothetical protein
MAVGATLPYLEPVQRVSNAILQRALNNPSPTRNAMAGMIRQAGPVIGGALGPAGAQAISHQ